MRLSTGAQNHHRVDTDFDAPYREFIQQLLTDDDICKNFVLNAVNECMGCTVTNEHRVSTFQPIQLTDIQLTAVCVGFQRCIDVDQILRKPTMLSFCSQLRTQVEDKLGSLSNISEFFTDRGILIGHIMGLGKSIINIAITACVVKLEKEFSRPGCKILVIAATGPIKVLKGEFQRLCMHSCSPIYLDDSKHKGETIRQWIRDNSLGAEVMLISTEDLISCKPQLALLQGKISLIMIDEAHDVRISAYDVLNYESKPKQKLIAYLREGTIPGGINETIHPSVVLSTGTPIINNVKELVSLLVLMAPDCLGVQQEDVEKVVRTVCKSLERFDDDDDDDDHGDADDDDNNDNISFLEELRIWLQTYMMCRVAKNENLIPRLDFILELPLHKDMQALYAKQCIADCENLTYWKSRILGNSDRLMALRTNELFELGIQNGMVNDYNAQLDQSVSEGHTSQFSSSSASSSSSSSSSHMDTTTGLSVSQMDISSSQLDLSVSSQVIDPTELSSLGLLEGDTSIVDSAANLNVGGGSGGGSAGVYLKARGTAKEMCLGIDDYSKDHPHTQHKLRAAVAIMESTVATGNKILAIARTIEVLTEIKALLDGMGLLYYYMDGDTDENERKNMVNDFEQNTNPDVKIFLGTMVMSTGWTLISATSMMIIETSDNPTEDDQSLYRLWRGFQKNQVLTWRIIMKHSIEVSVYNLALLKSKVNSLLLDQNTPYRASDCVNRADTKDGYRHTTNAFPTTPLQDVSDMSQYQNVVETLALTAGGKIIYDATIAALDSLPDIPYKVLLVNKK